MARNCSAASACAHLCMAAADGREVCSCRPGFRLAADGRSCEDVDECQDEWDPPCQQECNNTVGTFSCSCRPGYVLRPDKRSCKSVETAATLLLTNRVDIRQVRLVRLGLGHAVHPLGVLVPPALTLSRCRR